MATSDIFKNVCFYFCLWHCFCRCLCCKRTIFLANLNCNFQRTSCFFCKWKLYENLKTTNQNSMMTKFFIFIFFCHRQIFAKCFEVFINKTSCLLFENFNSNSPKNLFACSKGSSKSKSNGRSKSRGKRSFKKISKHFLKFGAPVTWSQILMDAACLDLGHSVPIGKQMGVGGT